MAGQPCKTPSDAEKYRDAYMANLNLQIKNNDKNLQANKLHQRTGVPATQISDYRTTSEKLADVEALRALVRSELLQIADSINANAIVQSMSVDELRFVAQNIDMIVKELKPKHKFGVLEPIFRSFLVLQMNAQMKADANAAGIMLENRGVTSLASLKQLETELVSERDISTVLQKVGDVPYRDQLEMVVSKTEEKLKLLSPALYKRLESIPDFTERVAQLENVARAIRELPSKKQLKEQIGLINRTQGEEKAERVAELIEMLDVPSLEFLEQIQEELPNRASQFEDPNVLKKELSKKRILEVVAPYLVDHSHEEIFGMSSREFKALRLEDLRGVTRDRIGYLMELFEAERRDVEEVRRPELSKTNVFTRTSAPPSRVYSEPTQAVRQDVTQRKRDTRNEESIAKYRQLQKTRTQSQVFQGLKENVEARREQDRIQEQARRERQQTKAQLTLRKVAQAKSLSTAGSPRRAASLAAAGESRRKAAAQAAAAGAAEEGWIARNVPQTVTQSPDVDSQKTTDGSGLKFGKFFLHADKLKDDIVCVRHKNGRNHPNMPTKRVSKGLGIVLRHIAGGANPSYDDLHKLSDEDRSHLSDLVRRCKVDVSVPEGKDADDLHQFEILQGEIGAGNDSPELVKKLKVVILRLMNKGRLPKGQAREILCDLCSLGF